MGEVSYNFRPCDCCLPINATFTLSGRSQEYECNDTCGEIGGDPTGGTVIIGEGLPCSYTSTFVAVPNFVDPCTLYKIFQRTDNWSNVLGEQPAGSGQCVSIFGGLTSQGHRIYTISNGICNVDVVSGGGPGQSADTTFTWSSPITSCSYVLVDELDIVEPVAGEAINKSGNSRAKTTSVITKVIHPPTVTCYLKVWIRGLVYSVNRIEEDGCGFPSEESDSFVVGPQYEYVWTGSGRPCINDPNKEYSDEENLIEGNVGWNFSVSGASNNVSKYMRFELKHSIVNGYEPKWPSERLENECKLDNYPRC